MPTTPSKEAKESLFDYLRGLSWPFTKAPQEDVYPAAAGSPESVGSASTDGNEDDHAEISADGKHVNGTHTRHHIIMT